LTLALFSAIAARRTLAAVAVTRTLFAGLSAFCARRLLDTCL
jgi:hypothetical protein